MTFDASFFETMPEEPDLNTYIDSDLWRDVSSRNGGVFGNTTFTGDITLFRFASMTFEEFKTSQDEIALSEEFFREMQYHVKYLICLAEGV